MMDPKENSDYSKITVLNFNQDSSSLVVGHEQGYCLYNLGSKEKLDLIYEDLATQNVFLVERLFSSSLVAVVSLNSPRKLMVFHFKKGTEICNYSYMNTIKAVRLNRMRIVVCLEESLYIHNIRDMKVLHTIRDTPPNPQGVVALTSCNENCLLAYPGSANVGEVLIFDAANLRAVTVISAHTTLLAAMTFNSDGSLFATASSRGTILRVFNVADNRKICEFRRSQGRVANVTCLYFSPDSSLLVQSSSTETIHIFRVPNPDDTESGEDARSMTGRMVSFPVVNTATEDSEVTSGRFMGGLVDGVWSMMLSTSQLLPEAVTERFAQGYDFATARLPRGGHKTVCAICKIEGELYVHVASADGYMYIFSICTKTGGACTLVAQIPLFVGTSGPNMAVRKGLAGGTSNFKKLTPIDNPDVPNSFTLNENDFPPVGRD